MQFSNSARQDEATGASEPLRRKEVTPKRPSGEPRGFGLDAVILTMAIACGLTVANLYYAQPLLALIAAAFGVGHGAAATVVTVTQLGYAAGLAFLVPLGDRLDNRRFASWALLAVAAALAAAALSPAFPLFLVMSAIIGVTSVTVQVLVPFAARLAPAHQRGRYVGRVMSGLLLGILLARSVASVAAAAWGWRSIYLISAVAMLLLAAALWRILPARPPAVSSGYGRLLASALPLIRDEPVLRRRAVAQALMFGAFSCFWTSIAYELISAHHLSQLGIAVFALVGAGGAAAALIAGRLGDRGLGRPVRGAAIALAVAAMLLAGFGAASLLLLAVAAVLLDLAVQANHVLSQRDMYGLRPDASARLNTVYMTTVFIGGAAASAVSGVLAEASGWTAVTLFGAALAALAGVVYGYDLARGGGRRQPAGPAYPPDGSS
jgi:predicted MFS family arabinose efflux permease